MNRVRALIDDLAARKWFVPVLVIAALLALLSLGYAGSMALTPEAAVVHVTTTPVPTTSARPVVVPGATVLDPRLVDPNNGSKLSDLFIVIFKAYVEGGQPAAEQIARDLGILDDQGVNAVLVLNKPYDDSIGVKLKEAGVEIVNVNGNHVTVRMPMDRLLQANANRDFTFVQQLLEMPEIVDVDAPQRPETNDRVSPQFVAENRDRQAVGAGPSEGVKATGADKWQAAGIRGANVKVGIIDSFARYRELLGKYLPAADKVIARDFTGKGFDKETNYHGTACAQIVHDMAPDATLYLANQDDLDQFEQAMDWLMSQKVDVISISLFFPSRSFDGKSPAAQKINEARASGIVVVTAAANEADSTFVARTTGAAGPVAVDIGGSPFVPVAYLNQADTNPQFRVVWDNNDADIVIHLADQSGKVYVTFQRQKAIPEPAIIAVLDKRLGGNMMSFAIEQRSGPPTTVRVRVSNGILSPYYRSAAMSLGDTASASGALAVAAVDWKTSQLAEYSSWGPTLDGRWKPEIAGPTHVSSFLYQQGQFGFTGTSAATPHVAGAAALVKSKFPNYAADQIVKFLLDNARPLPPPSGAYGPYAGGRGELALPDPASLR